MITSRVSSYDDSFTKRDCLRRLGRLITNQTLFVLKCDDFKKVFGECYFFICKNKEVVEFLDLYSIDRKRKDDLYIFNDLFEFDGITDWDNLIETVDNLDDDWKLTKNKFYANLLELGLSVEDYENFLKTQKKKIQTIANLTTKNYKR